MEPYPVTTSISPTILQPAPLPPGAVAPTNPAATTMDQEIDWQKLAAQNWAYQQNQNTAALYLNFTFPNWLLNYQKTGDYTMVAPNPPNGVVVEIVSDNPWQPQFPAIGPPVCAMPSYAKIPPPPPPGTLGIGVRMFTTNYWSLLPSDTMPANYITPAPVETEDGVTGLFQKVVYPFGGWYLKIG
jgi:hypothetical protein